MKRIIAFTFFLLFLAAFAFISFDGMQRRASEAKEASGQPALVLTGTNWALADTGGAAIEHESGVFVRFEDDESLGGFAACNNFFGSYTIEADTITISPLGATRKMCPQLFMDIEQTFMNALQKARSFRIDGDKLQLIDEQDRPLTLVGSTD